MDRVRIYIYTLIVCVLLAGVSTGSALAEIYVFGIQNRRVFEEASEDLTSKVIDPTPVLRVTTLYTIDPETGQTTEIGVTDSLLCTGMDFHPGTGVLYAVCALSEERREAEVNTRLLDDDAYLVRIDPATGDYTEVGPTGVVPQFGTPEIIDLSFRPDGTLFAHIVTKGGVILGTIDTSTGQFTEVGLLAGNILPGGLAFSASGRLYSADIYAEPVMSVLHLRDQANGGGQIAANLNLLLNENEVPYITTMDLNPQDGMLYGFLTDGQRLIVVKDAAQQRLLETTNYLVTVDPDTGEVDLRAPVDINLLFTAMAIRQAPIVSDIPTMSEWGLIAMSGLMLAGSVLMLRRRRQGSVA